MARPRFEDGKARTRVLMVRLKPDEYRRWKLKAGSVPISEWVRSSMNRIARM